jgi:hypothetical protein
MVSLVKAGLKACSKRSGCVAAYILSFTRYIPTEVRSNKNVKNIK